MSVGAWSSDRCELLWKVGPSDSVIDTEPEYPQKANVLT